MEKKAQHCSGVTMDLISSSVGSRKSGLITHQLESWPVRWNSAHGFSLVAKAKKIKNVWENSFFHQIYRFLMLLSEWAGKARFISSILIRLGLSRDRQNNLVKSKKNLPKLRKCMRSFFPTCR